MELETEMIDQSEHGEQSTKQIQQIFGLLHQLFNPLKPPKPLVDPAKLKSKIGFRPSN